MSTTVARSLKINGAALIINKSEMQYLVAISKMTECSLFISKAAIQYHSYSSLCLDHWYQRSSSEMVLWRPIWPSRTNTKKRCPFHHRELECKSRKSRDTGSNWSNRQLWFWSTKWSRAKANRVLPRERTDNNKHPLPTTQEKLYTWTPPDDQYWNQINYILCSQRWRSSIESAKTKWKLTLVHIMNSLLPNSDLNWSREKH